VHCNIKYNDQKRAKSHVRKVFRVKKYSGFHPESPLNRGGEGEGDGNEGMRKKGPEEERTGKQGRDGKIMKGE
jgi:hypothetical protein